MSSAFNWMVASFEFCTTTLRTLVSNHILFAIGVVLIVGYLLGKLADKLKLPVVTGYIIAGILLGESIGNVIELKMVHALRPITEIALGLIALAIGGEFSKSKAEIRWKGSAYTHLFPDRVDLRACFRIINTYRV